MNRELDGLLTFFASHHAIRADKTLREGGHRCELVPGPKDLSPNCGTAVRFVLAEWPDVAPTLEANRVEIDEVHRWSPSTDSWGRTRRGPQ